MLPLSASKTPSRDDYRVSFRISFQDALSFLLPFFIIAFGCDRSRGIEQGCQKNIVCSYGSSVQIRFKAADQCYSTDAGKQTHGIMQTAQTPVRQLEREHSGTDNG